MNASNRPESQHWQRLSGQFSIIALQGPRAFDILAACAPNREGYFAFTEAEVDGAPAAIARLGYSGERGVEILVPEAAARPRGRR